MIQKLGLFVALLAILLLSGCQGAGPGGGPGTAEIEHTIRVEIEDTDDIQNDITIVNSSDSSISNSEVLQKYIQKAIESGNTNFVQDINESEFENIEQLFKSVPTYDAGERATVPDESSYSRSIYIYHDGEVIEITLFAEQPG